MKVNFLPHLSLSLSLSLSFCLFFFYIKENTINVSLYQKAYNKAAPTKPIKAPKPTLLAPDPPG